MTPFPTSRRRRPALVGTVRPVLALAVLALAAACAPPSQQDIQTAQALSDLGMAFNDIGMQQSEMRDEIDSLRIVVARQDSVIRILANLAGVQLTR